MGAMSEYKRVASDVEGRLGVPAGSVKVVVRDSHVRFWSSPVNKASGRPVLIMATAKKSEFDPLGRERKADLVYDSLSQSLLEAFANDMGPEAKA